MKTITYLRMLKELNDHKYSDMGEYDVDRLFKLYTETEIVHFKDLFDEQIVQDFKDFAMDNIGLFQGFAKDENGETLNEDRLSILCLSHRLTLPFMLLGDPIFTKSKEDQETFVNDVEKIIGNSHPTVLDVGSGKIPYSSILLAKDNVGDIHTMDYFVLSDKSINNLGVTPHNEYLNKKTPIEDYDIIVANKACSAIEDIVYSCVNKKKPYYLKLCDCNAPGQIMENWKLYLRNIDKDIHFENGDYAFNLDL